MRVNFVLSEVATGLRRNLTMTVAMILTTAIARPAMTKRAACARSSPAMNQRQPGPNAASATRRTEPVTTEHQLAVGGWRGGGRERDEEPRRAARPHRLR